MGATNVWTGTITNDSITISQSQNVVRVTILCSAGGVTFLGSSQFNGTSSAAITFAVGQGITLSGSPTNPLDGITITAPSGSDVADVTISYQ
jgi:hypothetical protein